VKLAGYFNQSAGDTRQVSLGRPALNEPIPHEIFLQGGLVMPTYEFFCEKCNKTFTVTMRVSEYQKKKIQCPKCKGKKIKQVISSFQTITSKKS